jgi:hypothetical protein
MAGRPTWHHPVAFLAAVFALAGRAERASAGTFALNWDIARKTKNGFRVIGAFTRDGIPDLMVRFFPSYSRCRDQSAQTVEHLVPALPKETVIGRLLR